MKAVIYQPTYLPWSGFFGMIDAADIFVFYDDVQFIRQSWQRKNRIKFQNSEKWLRVPIIKNYPQNIDQVRINNSTNWKNKHVNYIYDAYHKAPFFDDYKSTIYGYYNREWEYLVELNTWIIKDLARILGIKMPQFIRSSEIEGVKGQKTDRVLDILKKLGADEDICGPGACSYLETQKFTDNGIKLYGISLIIRFIHS